MVGFSRWGVLTLSSIVAVSSILYGLGIDPRVRRLRLAPSPAAGSAVALPHANGHDRGSRHAVGVPGARHGRVHRGRRRGVLRGQGSECHGVPVVRKAWLLMLEGIIRTSEATAESQKRAKLSKREILLGLNRTQKRCTYYRVQKNRHCS